MRNANRLFVFLLGMAWLWGCGAANAATPAISAGGQHTIGLKSDGTVLSWGSDQLGQLGLGRLTQSSNPILSSGISGLTAISAGYKHTVALKGDGSVWAWGDEEGSTPAPVSGLTGVVAISAGPDHTVALKGDGSVWAWGSNGWGQLGDGTETTERSTPVQVSGLAGVVAISAGGYHTVALKGDGSVWAWGDNWSGQLGDGTFAQTNSPVLVVTPSVDGFLNLNTDSVIIPPPELQVPFFVSSSGGITDTSATVRTTTKFNVADAGTLGSVFVTAWVPSSGLGALGILAASMSHALSVTVTNDDPYSGGVIRTRQETLGSVLAAADANTFVLIQKTSSGWQPVVNGQLVPYATGVLGEQISDQTILSNTDPTNLKGAEFCQGYGTSAEEMTAARRMRVVLTIPDPNSTATASGSCIVAAGIKAIEFYKADIGHYFMTASSDEAAFLDSKPSWGWVRTGSKTFNIWPSQAAAPSNASPVCRFYGVFANGTVGSHFYTVDPDECAYVKGRLDWGWGYENDAFYAVKPAADGTCPGGTAPIYRAYNNGMSGAPNHRYMATQAEVNAMVAQGWVSEGAAFCGVQ